MYQFEDFIEKTNGAKNREELFSVFTSTLNHHGFDRVLFALVTDHKDIGLDAGVGIMQNYPEDWMKYYFTHGFDKIDPILSYGVHQMGAFEWKDIPERVALASKQLKCLSLGKEAGLNNGISIPLRGINNQMAGISVATTEKLDAGYIKNDLITAYSNQFYIAFKRLHAPKDTNPKNIVLTEKEKEVLTWAAAGKSDDDIGDILNISRHTVNMHFRNIFTKMNAVNRVMAIVMAISLGIIHPK